MTKTQRALLKAIKKSLGISGYILLVLWPFTLFHMNYSQLSAFDKFSLVMFVLWFSVLIVEVYRNYKNGGGRR